jgi:hypothetical protein
MSKRIKRSKRIRLVLLSGLSAGALAGCSPVGKPPLSAANVYTNDFYVPGAGYYHAPFSAWYPLPYNHFDPVQKQFYYGGQWRPSPCQSITNISSPTAQAAAMAEAMRTDVTRGGFGSSGGGFYVHS